MLTVKLQGGLGNWLFQIAAGEHIAKQTGREFFISHLIDKSSHSREDYFKSILRNWRECKKDLNNIPQVNESSFEYINWNSMLSGNQPVYGLIGYFQNYKYISKDFVSKLSFDPRIKQSYQDINTSAFIHIRGGDYKNHWFHDIKLDSYYESAIQKFPQRTHFYIFTNDIEYAKSKQFLSTISYSFVNENEIDSLFLMSQCGIGGICVNSSFSWWGAYLNQNRTIIMPNKWYNNSDMNIDGYYFPNVIKVDTRTNWQFVDKVVYINLKEREDRNRHMIKITKTFEDKVIRFDAIKNSIGALGCTQSHISVLKLAIKENWKNVLILEDDVEWNKFEEGYERLYRLSQDQYDVILLGGSCVESNNNKLISAQTTTGYLVNQQYFSTLLKNYEEGFDYLNKRGDPQLYAIDQYWKNLQAKDNWFIITPCLIYQKPDYSDIESRIVDYRSAFNI